MWAFVWSVINFPSRLANWMAGGEFSQTLCFASLHPEAPLWLLIVAAVAEWSHPAHLAWSTDR